MQAIYESVWCGDRQTAEYNDDARNQRVGQFEERRAHGVSAQAMARTPPGGVANITAHKRLPPSAARETPRLWPSRCDML